VSVNSGRGVLVDAKVDTGLPKRDKPDQMHPTPT